MGLNGEKDEEGRLHFQQFQQYPYCHTQFQALQCAHNRHSVHTTGRCNTPRFISSLVIELPIQSVATNTDFSSRLFMSCFAADIPLAMQTNWYYQLYLAH